MDVVELHRQFAEGVARGDPEVADRLLTRLRPLLGATPTVGVLLLAANLLTARHTATGSRHDLRDAFAALHRASEQGAADPDDPHFLEWAVVSAGTFIAAYAVDADPRVLVNAADLMRPLEQRLAGDHPVRPAVLHLYATALFLNQTQTDKTIHLVRECLAKIPPGSPQRPPLVSMLGLALLSQSQLTGDSAPAAEARTLLTTAVTTLPDGHPARLQLVPAYARSLLAGEDTDDVDLAISELGRALPRARDAATHTDLTQGLAQALLFRATRTGGRDDLDRAIALSRDATGVARHGALETGGRAYLHRFVSYGDRADLDRAIDMFHQRGAYPAPPDIGTLASHAHALRLRFDVTGDAADLHAAVELLSGAETAEGPGADLARIILALILSVRAMHHDGDLGDIRRALALLDRTRPSTTHTTATGTALVAAYQVGGDPADLERAIGTLRRDGPGPASHREEIDRLMTLGAALTARAGFAGDGGLPEAITVLRRAGTMIDDGDVLATALRYQLANALVAAGFRDTVRLEEGILLLREILSRTDLLTITRTLAVGRLGTALTHRFLFSGRPEDLRDGIDRLREALARTPIEGVGRWSLQADLATALSTRFEQHGDPADLEAAIELVGTAAEQAGQTQVYGTSALRITLLTRLERLGGEDRLDESITMLYDTVGRLPRTHHMYDVVSANLAVALTLRFRRDGRVADLDRAITIERALVRDGTPDPLFAANLAGHLSDRYRHHRHLADLDEAIAMRRLAIDRAAPGHPGRATMVAELGGLLRLRADLFGDEADLREAVEKGRHAVELAGPDLGKHDQGSIREDLATTLIAWFDRTGQRDHLEEAIDRLGEAIAVSPAGDRNQAAFLATLGDARLRRWRHSRDEADLRAAVTAHRDAVARLRPDGPTRSVHLAALAEALILDGVNRGDVTTLAAARDHGREAAQHRPAPAETRIDGAAAWGKAARWLGDMPEVQRAYSYAVDLLATLAWHGINRSSQEKALGRWTGAPPQAAAAALTNDDPPGAVEILERGRGILWTGLLDARSSLAEVADRAPHLAAELLRVRRALDTPAGLRP
ncbi:hypothetical protein GCM10010112_69300 [Actinoplanes lobatus]|uniref:Tetratricopeptide (TPR) repeat protein n=1 Tax=Actinoplanes lobatus TaxID=113568 RepID=A0A7W7MK34_9ACTN|nr:hypothetical protein [Actinoplanes lobatus]MBB4753093.1 tetratricopeptide (TPR) repeat protein [Actinoplanes lobatus]GGN87073.1 hypothetical protein GCM10010112_69300 [Actinoplanes lobatus]GIE39700.1 hypothetical protein Alo02nite_25980 [Actinoplanes lobatus]